LAERLNNDGKTDYAVKSLLRRKVEKSIVESQNLKQELEILIKLDSPYIVKYHGAYIDREYIHMVMESLTGGDLKSMCIDKTRQNTKIDQKQVKKVVYHVLKGLAHINSYNIAHRDIKLENVMLDNSTDTYKLIDFGLSKKLVGKSFKEGVGTPYYVAPEIFDGQYGLQCDIWSLGVLTYRMLAGTFPFEGDDTDEVYDKISLGNYEYHP